MSSFVPTAAALPIDGEFVLGSSSPTSGWLSVVEHPAREAGAELQDLVAEVADPADGEARSISVVGTLTSMSRMNKS